MSQISAFNPADPALANNGINRFSEMTSEDFIRIIFTELSNQDPLEPNDTGALLDQLNSIRSIESDLKVVDKLESLVQENQLASAGNLLGKFVRGLTAGLNFAEGFALTVVRQNDKVMLELDTGQIIPFENVSSIVDPSLFNNTATQGDDQTS